MTEIPEEQQDRQLEKNKRRWETQFKPQFDAHSARIRKLFPELDEARRHALLEKEAELYEAAYAQSHTKFQSASDETKAAILTTARLTELHCLAMKASYHAWLERISVQIQENSHYFDDSFRSSIREKEDEARQIANRYKGDSRDVQLEQKLDYIMETVFKASEEVQRARKQAEDDYIASGMPLKHDLGMLKPLDFKRRLGP